MKPVRVELAHRANYGVRRGKIEWIVMHYTANDGDSGMSNARYFQKALNPVASAHYFVDDREIVQSVPDEYVAYHCGAYKYRHPFCRNYNSIGVEMCDSVGAVPAATRERTAAFVRELMDKYGVPVENVLRHYDVTGKSCPRQMAGKNNAEWEAFKASVKALLNEQPAPAPTTKEETINMELRMLRRGMEGNDVRAAMLLMKDKGYYPDEIWSGDKLFGPKMEAGLRRMQADHDLGVDGILGAASWNFLLK